MDLFRNRTEQDKQECTGKLFRLEYFTGLNACLMIFHGEFLLIYIAHCQYFSDIYWFVIYTFFFQGLLLAKFCNL